MRILVTIGAGLLLTTTALAQVNEEVVDGKKLDKEKMELHDYLPAIHGTIRAKYEYQTATDESRFQVRNARFSLTGNVLPIVAYKAEIDLSDQGKIAGCLYSYFPNKACQLYDRTDEGSFYD